MKLLTGDLGDKKAYILASGSFEMYYFIAHSVHLRRGVFSDKQ